MSWLKGIFPVVTIIINWSSIGFRWFCRRLCLLVYYKTEYCISHKCDLVSFWCVIDHNLTTHLTKAFVNYMWLGTVEFSYYNICFIFNTHNREAEAPDITLLF